MFSFPSYGSSPFPTLDWETSGLIPVLALFSVTDGFQLMGLFNPPELDSLQHCSHTGSHSSWLNSVRRTDYPALLRSLLDKVHVYYLILVDAGYEAAHVWFQIRELIRPTDISKVTFKVRSQTWNSFIFELIRPFVVICGRQQQLLSHL